MDAFFALLEVLDGIVHSKWRTSAKPWQRYAFWMLVAVVILGVPILLLLLLLGA